MNLDELKSQLGATKPWPLHFFKQSAALKELMQAQDPRAAEILADAVDGNHRLAGDIKAALTATTDAEKIDRLCCIWAKKRQPWLGAIIVANKWTGQTPAAALLCALKCGRLSVIGTDPRTLGAALAYVEDSDANVRAGVVAYAGGLPNEARVNDALYDLWIRTQSPEIKKLIGDQQRFPSSVAKETLLRLASGDVDGYLALEDENGQIFREAWGIAPDALRQRVTLTVTKSGNSRLIDAYTRALGARDGLDVKTVLEARKTAADEDGLFDAARPLRVLELLDLCARWAESGQLPKDPARRRAAENAVAAWREVGKIEFEQAPALPAGLVDFFDAQMEGDLGSPDPFVRLHAAVNGKGVPDVKKLAASEHWPDRLAARLLAPELAVSGEKEHVQWTSLAGGVISNVLFATTAEGTPAEHETLLRLREANAGRNDRVAVINRGLAGVVLAFQSIFQRGAITSQADDSAEERGAIQEAGAAAEEDLKF